MKYLKILLMALTATVLAACGGSDDATSTDTATKGTLSLKLTDAPASEYKEVWVTINEVRIHRSETAEEGDGGWETLPMGGDALPLQVDLLTLRNGVLAGLGDIQLDEGRYTQMRLVLGGKPGDNYVVVQVDENTTETHELTTPSAQRSGLKLIHPFDVVGGETLELVLDFDAARSVVKAGKSGKYLLKPVIAVIPTVIGGQVVNAEVAGAFTADDIALAAGASVSLQSVDADGKVLIVRAGVVAGDGTWDLSPVPPGDNYNLVVVKPGFRTMVIGGVSVAEGDALAVPSFPLVALGADDAEIAANTGEVDGTVDAAAAVAVQALQPLGGGNVIEVAHVGVAEGEGGFAMSLPVPAPMVAPYMEGEAPVFSPLGDPAPYDFVAVGLIGDVPVAGAVTGVNLTGGDTTVVDIPLAVVL